MATECGLALYEKFCDTDLATWTSLLAQSVVSQNVHGYLFPKFPSEDIQISMVGGAGVHTISEMSNFYCELHRAAEQANFLFDKNTKILDFGCGFGRLTRFFLKDTETLNVHGADCESDFINICKNDFRDTAFNIDNFHLLSPMPPYSFSDNSFDLITAYSVFTHLSEEASHSILKEFNRILKPGGLLVITLRQRKYLEFCSCISNPPLNSYAHIQAASFGDFNACIQRYVRGEYMFVPNGGGGSLSSSFYGDTVVPPSYVRKNWLYDFDLVHTFDDLTKCSQAFLALKNRKVS